MNDSTMQAVQRLAIYDPLLLDEHDFVKSFVAREKTLSKLVRNVKSNNAKKLLHHQLLHGQRGMGKTTLLRRLALAVRDDEELSSVWIPLSFREEQYNVATLADFWLNCADTLADWCQAAGDDQSADLLDNAIARPDSLWLTIEKVTKLHNRRLLLLIDNLQIILENLSDQEQWAFREKLQAKNGPLVVACTPVMIECLANRESAFYEFFRLSDLTALSVSEIRSCLRRIAEQRGDSGQRVLKDLQQQQQRIKVLHTLCGGNPRTLILVYHVLETLTATGESRASSGSGLTPLLEGVLESTTPLYKARTDELSPQQRRVLDAVALHWDPIHSSQLAELTGLPNSSLSPVLKRLSAEGIVERVLLGGKRFGYQLCERFYNIWYLMRNGSRRSRERLRWLTRFLSMFYSQYELANHTRRLVRQPLERNEWNEAMMYALDDGPVRYALRQKLTEDLLNKNVNVVQDLVPNEDFATELVEHHQRTAKVVDDLVTLGYKKSEAIEFSDLLARSVCLSMRQKQKIAGSIRKSHYQKLTKIFVQEKENVIAFYGKEIYTLLANEYANGRISGSDDREGSLAVLSSTSNPTLFYAVLGLCYNSYRVEDWEELKKIAPSIGKVRFLSVEVWVTLGDLLQHNLQRYEESEQAYREAIKIDDKDGYAWNGLGNLFCDHLSQFDDSKTALETAIQLTSGPDVFIPTENLIWLDLICGRLVGLEQRIQALTSQDPCIELLNAGLAVCQGNPGQAVSLLEPVFEANADSLWSTFYDDLLRLTRLFKQHGFSDFYLDWLANKRFDVKLAPYVLAVEAYCRDRDVLLRSAPEIREAAELILSWLESDSKVSEKP